MASSKVSLKLLIDKKGQKVLFAEAGRDFVDFLFSLLALPIGTVMSLVCNKDMAGGLPMLYQSLSDLDYEYIKNDQRKEPLLKPTPPKLPFDLPRVRLLPINQWYSSTPLFTPATGAAAITFYKCGACRNKMLSTEHGSKCKDSTPYGRPCGQAMTTAVKDYFYKSDADTNGGFVKGSVTYMVADDLSVSPMSTISNIYLLNQFNIKDLGALEEKVVQIGMDEGLELLRHSWNSKTVLTNVFLGDTATKVKNLQEL